MLCLTDATPIIPFPSLIYELKFCPHMIVCLIFSSVLIIWAIFSSIVHVHMYYPCKYVCPFVFCCFLPLFPFTLTSFPPFPPLYPFLSIARRNVVMSHKIKWKILNRQPWLYPIPLPDTERATHPTLNHTAWFFKVYLHFLLACMFCHYYLNPQHNIKAMGFRRNSSWRRDIFLVTITWCGKRTLIHIIKEKIRPGTAILSDCWQSCDYLDNEDFWHLMVNHSLNFVDSDTGCHTKNIESLKWQISLDMISCIWIWLCPCRGMKKGKVISC